MFFKLFDVVSMPSFFTLLSSFTLFHSLTLMSVVVVLTDI